MASVMASAEPSNSEVLAAVNNGNFTEAESMLDTVVQNHPRSAKAHYLLSEVYAKENKVPMAKQELAVALGIDPSGKFASAGKLAAYQTALNSTATTATTTTTTHQHLMVQPSQQYSPPIQHSYARVISFLVVLFIMTLVLVAILVYSRFEFPPQRIYVNGGTPIYPSGGSPSIVTPPLIVTPSASSYPPTMYPPVHQYSSGGMGVGSVALGAAGGLVAGMALESALSNGHYHGGGYRNGFDLYDSYEDTTTTTTTTTSESTPSFSFDSGSDQSSGWDSGGSSSSDSGSSWDSGGSSSSDSGSSWD